MKFLCASGASTASDVIITVFLVLLTVISIAALIVLLCGSVKNGEPVKSKALWLSCIFAAGFALRLIFAMCVRGYRDDYAIFTTMFDHIRDFSASDYYAGSARSVLYPAVYPIYLVFGGLCNSLGLSDYALGTQFMVKLPLIIADLLTAVAVYKIAGRYFNERVAVALCGFVCVCPIFLISSALWSSPITFMVMFASFGCLFIARKSYAAAIAFMTAAAYSSKEGIYIFPVMAVFCIFHVVRAALNIRRDAPKGTAVLDGEYRAVFTIPLAVALTFLGAYLVTLISSSAYSQNPFVLMYEYLIEPLADWSYFTYNGLSVFAVFGRNGAVPNARFPVWMFVVIFTLIITAVVCIVYFSKRNRATLVMLAAYSLFTMQIYYPGSTAVSMSCAFALLLAAYALVKDKRLLAVLFVSGLAYVINSCIALVNAGYMNNLIDYYFGSEQTLLSGGLSGLSITCAVLAVAAHLYFTVVTISVGMTGQKKLLSEAHGLGDSIVEFLSIKKVK